MLRDKNKSFLSIQVLVDAITVSAIWFLSYLTRFYLIPGGQSGLEIFFLKLTLFVVVPIIYFFYKNGLYSSLRFSTRAKEVLAVITASTQGTLAFVFMLYFFAPERVSRFMLLFFGISAPFTLVITRMIVRNMLRSLRRRGHNLRHYLLVGDSPQMRKYIEMIYQHKDAGIKFRGIVDGGNLGDEFDIKKIAEITDQRLEELSPDAIIIGYCANSSASTDKILKNFHDGIVPIHVLPDVSYSLLGTRVEDFAGIPLLILNGPRIGFAGQVSKRIFDVTLTFPGLIILSPLLLLIAALVKLTSPGPIFYGQKRMGLDGHPFMMWKFRSMRVADNPQEKPGWTVKDDPRRTKFGTFLRRTSFDELPQIWNVFIGEMSLVGPRPEQPHFVDKFKNEIPAYMLRHKMKSGITGWAQINGWRGDTSIEKRIEYDIYYIKNWSVVLDIKILLLTFLKGFISKNAY